MPVRSIINFFKPFTVPANRVPSHNAIEDEIVVASPRKAAARRDVVDAPERREGERSSQTTKLLSRPSSDRSASRVLKRSRTSRESSGLSTPPTRAAPQARDAQGAISSLERTAEENNPCYSDPTPSRQRVMTDVEVPLPVKVEQPSHPTPKAEAPPVTTSFSSFSTLSTLPCSSQSSSRRIVKDGLQAVTNSDSGSDSDAALGDLDSFMPRKKIKMTPPGKSVAREADFPSTAKPARQSARLSDKSSNIGSRGVPQLPPSPPPMVYKHGLLAMMKQNQKRQSQDARIAEAEAAVAEAERVEKAQAAAIDAQPVDGKVLAETMAEDSDEGARMLQAMDRTEALQDEEQFRLFMDAAPSAPNGPFPTSELPDKSWAKILKDENGRADACLTGFVADVAAKHLTMNTTRWFLHQLLHEPREELCEAYVGIIRLALAQERAASWLPCPMMEGLYRTSRSLHPAPFEANTSMINCICGSVYDGDATITCDMCGKQQHTICYYPLQAGRQLPKTQSRRCVDCESHNLDVSTPVSRQQDRRFKPLLASDNTQRPWSGPPGLRYVARVLQYWAPLAGTPATARTLCDLALANIDENVKEDISLRFALQDAIEAVSNYVGPGEMDVLHEHVKMILNKQFNLPLGIHCRMVTSMPAMSLQAHTIRRRLALHLILQDDDPPEITSERCMKAILHHLQTSPKFSISDTTNYALLCSLTDVLDIAIDAGFSDFTFHTSERQPAKPAGLFSKAPSHSSAEHAFNAQVDALTNQLRLMASRIKDAGASHLRRTEAKSALERLIVRLEFLVRTRPKVKRGVFDGDLHASSGLLEGYMKRAGEQLLDGKDGGDAEKGFAERRGVGTSAEDGKDEVDLVPTEMLSDRHESDDEDEHTTSGARDGRTNAAVAIRKPTEGLWDLKNAIRL